MSFSKRALVLLCMFLLVAVSLGCGSDKDKKSDAGSTVDYEKSLIGQWSLDGKASLAAAKFDEGDAAKPAAEGFVNSIKMMIEFKDDGTGSLALEMGPDQKQTIPVKYDVKGTDGKTVTVEVTAEGKVAEDFNFKFADENTIAWSAVNPESKQGIPGPLKHLIMTRAN